MTSPNALGGHGRVALGDYLIYATAQRVGTLLITGDGDLGGEDGIVVLGQKKPPVEGKRAG